MVLNKSWWIHHWLWNHNSDVIMSVMVSQITSILIVSSNVCSGTDQRKHQSSTSVASVRGIHRWPVNSPHKGPVTRKMFSTSWCHHDNFSADWPVVIEPGQELGAVPVRPGSFPVTVRPDHLGMVLVHNLYQLWHSLVLQAQALVTHERIQHIFFSFKSPSTPTTRIIFFS